MLTFDELKSRLFTQHPKHVDPAFEVMAKELAADFGFVGRSQSLAEALQDALDDWLDEQEQADRKESAA